VAETTVELDNLAAGDDVAVDLVSSKMYQYAKMAYGADGTVTKVTSTSTNPLPVASVGDAAENAAVSGNPVLTGGRYDSSSRTLGDGDVGALALNVAGEVIVAGTVALSAVDNAVLDAILVDTTAIASNVGGVQVDTSTFTATTDDGIPIFGLYDASPTTVADGNAGVIGMTTDRRLYVDSVAKSTGGMSYHTLAMAAADNDAVIQASATTVYFISVQSIDTTPVYLKLFDAASITPGTTSADMQFMCPSQGTALGSGVTLNFGSTGIQFATGLCALVSTGIALDNNTAVSANEVIVTIGYE